MRNTLEKNLPKRRLLTQIAFVLLVITNIQTVHAQNVNALKAAYVFYFSKFVSWEDTPLSQLETINICFNDKDYAIQKQFYSLTGKTNGNKPLKIIDINDKDINATSCHIIYSPIITKEIMDANKYTLLVSNDNEQNSDITFLIKKNKLRFNINRERIHEKQLKVSSRLLRLAAKVNK